MDFDKLAEIIFGEMGRVINENKGLDTFASNRAKIEGWVKVELVRILVNSDEFKNIIPEYNEKNKYVDILAGDWCIEIKICTTNYGISKEGNISKVKDKSKPITDNINGILDDIDKLKEICENKNKAVFFIVYPLDSKDKRWWENHLNKIKNKLNDNMLLSQEFKFNNGIEGIMYLGLVA